MIQRQLLLLAQILLLVATVGFIGCGGGEGTGDLSQEFEKPETPPQSVQDPPDTGDELSPRDRR